MTNHEWALAYATHGLVIFPVWWIDDKGRCACGTCEAGSKNAGKHPIIAGGFKHASKEPSVIDVWFTKWPKANLACLPGASGYLVLDLDGPAGMDSAKALGLLAEPTLEVQSGRADGGRHRWYRHPGGTIGNRALATGIDVRADNGYVMLPPSRHYTGNVYQWLGRFDEVAELPATIVQRLQSPSAPIPSTSGADAIALQGPSIRDELLSGLTEGGRNNALTRYAGRLFAKGLTLDEVQVTLLGVNQSACQPPLPVTEVLAIARNIHGAEQRSGVVRTPRAGANSPVEATTPATPALTLAEARSGALAGARAVLARDPRHGVEWWLPSIRKLMGPMLPGEMHTLGALSGNGKTSVVMSQLQYLRMQRVPTLYVPLEIDPALALLREAAWMLGLDVTKVLRGEWWNLPEGSKEAIDTQAEELANDPCVSYVPDKVVNGTGLLAWMAQAKAEMGARVAIADHVHRMSPGGKASDTRINLNGMIVQLANGFRELDMVGILTAQLNRKENEGLDRYKPPTMERIKETSAIAEESWTVSMVSRALIHSVSQADFTALKLGKIDARELAAPNVMVWTCRKHRLDDGALDRSVRLAVRNGRVEEQIVGVQRDLPQDFKEAACQ